MASEGGGPHVFVLDSEVVDQAFETIVARVRTDADLLLGGALDSARAEGERLRGRVGPPGWPVAFAKEVEIERGPVRVLHDHVLLAFSWTATAAASLFPQLDADLEIAPYGLAQTEVLLRARYEPPGGTIGRGVDQLLLRRVAESTLRAFLARICDQLNRDA
ncbi:MAG: hypothetical protein M0Z33_06570 [Actinomycetota bacterium]|nr:hypothetical protein [Actinomycetota bacterium]